MRTIQSMFKTGFVLFWCGAVLMDCGSKEKRVAGKMPNAAFEILKDGKPESWEPFQWRGEGEFSMGEGRTGNSVHISSQNGTDAAWAAVVSIKPFSRYRLSGWIKTEDLDPMTGRGALLNVHGLRYTETDALIGDNDWTLVQVEFESGRNDGIQVNCLFGGWGESAGKAWYDDIELELLDSDTLNPSVVVRCSERGDPISPLIYGQFIEHLGRCIYGGIWAEMLEDRKFYYPIEEFYAPWGEKDDSYWKAGVFRYLTASPWKPVGPAGSVTMDREHAYTGEHSTKITLPGGGTEAGIGQEGLALEKGKGYQGRVVLAGTGDASPVRVRLLLEGNRIAEQVIPSIQSDFQTYPISFVSPADCENAWIEIVSSGSGFFRVGAVSLMPEDNINGFRKDVLALLRELNSPIYRWPGGNFVSGYNWRDGIGDRDKRPPRKNPAWTGIESNDVGLHEYMDLMRLIEAEPFVAVNTGLGTVNEVADEVSYCNAEAGSPMGRLRAANGHPEPFGITWWAVGNEMYGTWQLGHMPLEEYVKKHNRVAAAMHKADPNIRLVGVGSVGEWSETMLRLCGDAMDLISEHIYCQERPGLLGHTAQLKEEIRWKAEAHRKYRQEIPGLEAKDIRIAMDEWNYWYGDYVYGELGTRYFHKDGLGVAIGLHEYFRNSDLFFMANYAQTVNVIGAIKTTRTSAALETTGLVLKLYRERYGTVPVTIWGAQDPLDVAAAWTEGKAITLSVVNPTLSRWVLPVRFHNAESLGGNRCWVIRGNPEEYNTPGEKPRIRIEERKIGAIGESVELEPASITLFYLPMKSVIEYVKEWP